jgi:hypothetical protein
MYTYPENFLYYKLIKDFETVKMQQIIDILQKQ